MKKKILISIIPFLFYLILGTVFWGNHNYILFSQLLFQLVFTGYIFNRFVYLTKLKTIFITNTLIVIIFIITSIIVLDLSRAILYILFIPVFSYIGIQLFTNRKYILIPLSLLFSYFLSFTIFNDVMALSNQKEYFINKKIPEIVLKNNKNEIFNLPNNKIIILDFWFTKCPPCLASFPHLEKVHEKYAHNKNIEIYAVNSPLPNEKFQELVNFSSDLKYEFPFLFTNSIKNTKEAFEFSSFPHIIIIKNNTIRFSGYPNYNTLFNNLEDEIEKLINE